MITLTIKSDFLFQINKNHLEGEFVNTCILRFTGISNKKVIDITAYDIQEFANFYLITVDTLDFGKLDSSARLEVVTLANNIIFQSDIKVK